MIDLMSKEEVCTLLRCAPRTLDRWRSMWKARGVDIGEVRIRRKMLFRRDRIERLVLTPKLWLVMNHGGGVLV
jgi:hypothetical protein